MIRFYPIYFLLFCLNIQGQNNTKYYPQEELIIEPCLNADDTNKCLYDYLSKKVNLVLLSDKAQRQLPNYEKDTLSARADIVVNKQGEIDFNKSRFWLGNQQLQKKLNGSFKTIFKKLRIKEVRNKRNDPTAPKHFFRFNHLLNKEGKRVSLNLIENKNVYSGGVVEEAPRYPGCETLSEDQARNCFQEKLTEHIKHHFRYPKEAQKKGISGTVHIMFTINKTGQVENIKMRAPHQLLEQEASRILSYLPQLEPGKHNGVPVKIPFSFPMHFKLR